MFYFFGAVVITVTMLWVLSRAGPVPPSYLTKSKLPTRRINAPDGTSD